MDESRLGLPDTVVPLPSDDDETTASLQVSTNGQSSSAIALSTATCLSSSNADRKCLVVGRQAATADVRIQHGSLSRQHAVLFYTRGAAGKLQLCILDLGSKKGTHLNDLRISARQPIPLQSGDQIVFGTLRSTVFTAQLPSSSQSKEESPADETVPKTAAVVGDNEPLQSSPAVDKEPPGKQSQPQQPALTGRQQRQAEIDAMVASLDQAPNYQPPPQSAATEPIAKNKTSSQTSDKSGDNKTQATIAQKYGLPVTSELTLLQSSSASDDTRRTTTTCLAMDAAGGRFVVGSRDSLVRFFDFGGMGRSRTSQSWSQSQDGGDSLDVEQASFATTTAREGYPCVAAKFSATGDSLLVATTSVQPKVLSREGQEVVEFARGDMYVTDQTKTVGHTAEVTCVDWHPLQRSVMLTGSRDGSVRLWNIETGKRHFDMLTCDKVFLIKNARGQRARAVTAACFHPGGREFAVGTDCGAIQIWNTARVAARPERAVYDAHNDGNGQNQHGINSLAYNVDGSLLVSRSSDGESCKVWNAKRLSRSSRPLVTCRGVPTVHEVANAVFSSNGRIVCAGASEYQPNEHGQRFEVGSINFFRVPESVTTQTDSPVIDPILSLPVDVPNTSPVIVQWHPKLNQVLVSCSNGSVIIYYDVKLSSNGALLTVKHKTSRKRVDAGEEDLQQLLASRAESAVPAAATIFTPLAQPRNRSGGAAIVVGEKKRKREERKDPVRSREPERPVTDKHKTGAQAGGQVNFQQFVSDQTTAKAKAIAGKDPREALFAYKEGKSYVSQAYEGNKERILAEKTAEEEEAEIKKKHKT